MKVFLYAIVPLTVAATALWWQSPPVPVREERIVIGGVMHRLLVADEPREHRRGLGNRDTLDADTVMLFTFPENGRHGIWMKDMRFAIDIVWLDDQNRIVHIEKEIAPETYPEVFTPEHDTRYVIEMHAGRASELLLEVGQQLEAWPSG